MKAEHPPFAASTTATRRGPSKRLHPVELCVRWLLAALDRLEVPNVVLRGDRELPRIPASVDLAVACAPHHADRFERMLQRAATRYGVQVVARHGNGYLRQFQLRGVDTARQHRLVQLDLHTAETCQGVPILAARRLLQGRTRERGHARPDVVVSALVDFLGPYLSCGAMPDAHLARLATVLEQWPAQTRDLMGDIFGTRVADELAEGLRDVARTTLCRSASRARRAALRRAFSSAPLSSLVHCLSFGFAALIRPLFPPRFQPLGKDVSMLGAEGSGKSAGTEAPRRTDVTQSAPTLLRPRQREVA